MPTVHVEPGAIPVAAELGLTRIGVVARDGRSPVELAAFSGRLSVLATDSVGIDQFRDWSPDVVVVDLPIGASGLSDRALIERLQAVAGPVPPPIVVLAEAMDEPRMRRALDCGADDQVTRPLVAGALCARVRAHAECTRLRRRLAGCGRGRISVEMFESLVVRLSRLSAEVRLAGAELTAGAPPAAHALASSLAVSVGKLQQTIDALMRFAAPATNPEAGEIEPALRTAMAVAEGALACSAVWLRKPRLGEALGLYASPDRLVLATTIWLLGSRGALPRGGELDFSAHGTGHSVRLTLRLVANAGPKASWADAASALASALESLADETARLCIDSDGTAAHLELPSRAPDSR